MSRAEKRTGEGEASLGSGSPGRAAGLIGTHWLECRCMEQHEAWREVMTQVQSCIFHRWSGSQSVLRALGQLSQLGLDIHGFQGGCSPFPYSDLSSHRV